MSKKQKKVSNNDLQNSQLGGGFVDANTVHAGQIGGDIYNVFANQPPTLTRQEYRNRQALLSKVKTYWIKGVLEKSLYHQVLIELGLEERLDAIPNPLSEILEIGNNSPQLLSEGTKIIDVFDQIGTGATLLILGEPGSGKTTTLLELARALIARAEQDTNQLIPVVFNLSSWAKKRQRIIDWLVEELNDNYDIPNKIGKAWLTQQQLLPLLDGLDEVKRNYRDHCIAQLNRFKKNYNVDLVVCSRIKDYQALSNRLNFQSSVCIRLLTLQQVCHYLDSFGADLTGLRTLIEQDQEWQELAQSPLMLNIMILAYQGVAVDDLPRTNVVEELRLQLFHDYIKKMFKRRKTNQRYKDKDVQVKHWLIWMAQTMLEESQTVFSIGKMQPSWLRNRNQKRIYNLMLEPMLGLTFGLMFWLMGGLMLVMSILDMMLVVMLGVILGLMLGVILGLMLGLMFWLIFGLMFGMFWLIALMGGLIGQVIGYPMGWLMIGLMGGLSLRLIGLTFGLIDRVVNGGKDCIQHFSLRLVLYRNKYIPWNYARFLDYAADRIFLQKVGGGYIFIHRMLMEHFAQMKPEN